MTKHNLEDFPLSEPDEYGFRYREAVTRTGEKRRIIGMTSSHILTLCPSDGLGYWLRRDLFPPKETKKVTIYAVYHRDNDMIEVSRIPLNKDDREDGWELIDTIEREYEL